MTKRHRIPCRSRLALAGMLMMAFLPAIEPPATAQHYKQTNLVSDISGLAGVTDPLLVNPWGMSFSPTSPFWVSNQGTNTSTLYAVDGTTGAVAKVPLNVSIPASPTGQIFNGTGDFIVTQGGASGSAFFIFAALDGTISGWSPIVPPPPPSMQAILAVTGASPAVYTGMTLATRGSDPFLYAANVASGGIDVFDKNFAQVSVPGGFIDASLPSGDSPFNIKNIGGSLFVTYLGPTPVVDVFDVDGNFQKRLVTGGTLINPWGITIAPHNFGKFSNALLIGNFNFGDPSNGPGWISAFNPITGSFRGLLESTPGHPIAIDGLWTLTFGNGGNGGIRNVLYFSAGIQQESHGLFGSLSWQPPGHR